MDSHYLAYILRHKPEEVNIKLDTYGYVNIDTLCRHLNITKEELDNIVNSNTRFVYNKDNTKIKAAHGHSVKVKYENESIPPEFLYHGTSDRFLDSILKDGILPETRVMVHLSSSIDDAKNIGLRHARTSSNLIVLKIRALDMYNAGYKFYKSEDNVWLTKEVPTRYIVKGEQ